MKVLIFTNQANGLVLFRKELLQAFTKEGWETVVSVPWDEKCKKIEELGCKVRKTQLERRGMNPIKDMKLLIQYLALLKEERPDVVLTYTIKPNLYGGLACRMRRVPYLMNITGLGTSLENPGLLGKVLIQFYRFVAAGARCVFFQNEGNRSFMQNHKIARNNSCLLPGSGVNLKEHPLQEYPTEKDGMRFLAVLRIMRDKGVSEFLEAATILKKEYQNLTFDLVGGYEEEYRAEYEPWLQELEKQGVIRYLGHSNEVPKIMADSHVIVHPSYHEGLSNVLLEAAACGRPVLASNIAGCKETLVDGISGLLFESKSTDSLVESVRKIVGFTSEERKEMGIRGRNHVEAIFDRQKVIEAYLTEIKKIKK